MFMLWSLLPSRLHAIVLHKEALKCIVSSLHQNKCIPVNSKASSTCTFTCWDGDYKRSKDVKLKRHSSSPVMTQTCPQNGKEWKTLRLRSEFSLSRSKLPRTTGLCNDVRRYHLMLFPSPLRFTDFLSIIYCKLVVVSAAFCIPLVDEEFFLHTTR